MKILVTGSTGLLGSRFKELLEQSYEFDEINSKSGIDILNREAVFEKFQSSQAEVVLHLAAKTDVDGCELDKEIDKKAIDGNNFDEIKKNKTAWAVNVLGTKNIVEASAEFNKKIIFMSTDFVFNGQKKSYSEEDIPDPINWYSKTKYEGEKLVQNSGLDFIIARVAYPYRAYFQKKDFVRALIEKLNKGQTVSLITDHIIVPTFIDDVVNALDVLIQREEKGIFNVVGSEAITPYNACLKICEVFNLDKSLVLKTTRREYFKDKAPRPFCLKLINDKIGLLGIEMSTFEKGLIEVKNQQERINI